MSILPPFEVYIDESGDSFFEPRSESTPYVVCAIAIPITKKQEVLDLLPRNADGVLLKSSSQGLTDEMMAEFSDSILKHNIFISLVGVDTSSKENANIVNKLAENANKHRRKKISQANLMYALAVKQAIINIWGHGKVNFFDLILDSNSFPKKEFIPYKETLKTELKKRNINMSKISKKTEQEKPLLYAADTIAGIARRWDSHQDVPKSWEAITKGRELKKIFIENGFEVYNAI